jgi:hypothetical protein
MISDDGAVGGVDAPELSDVGNMEGKKLAGDI